MITRDDYESLRPSVGLIPAHDALIGHPDLDGTGIELAMDFEFLALECGADPSWTRQKLTNHQRRRAGRKGGMATFARYGRPYYRALARVRWGTRPRRHPPNPGKALDRAFGGYFGVAAGGSADRGAGRLRSLPG